MNNPPTTLAVFLCGTLGALAPEIVRLYALRRARRLARFAPAYGLISALYAALGGALAVILPAANLYAAFYAGVTLPVTISTLMRQRKPGVTDPSPAKPAAAPMPALVALFRTHADGLFGG